MSDNENMLTPDDIQPIQVPQLDGALGEQVAAALAADDGASDVGSRLIRTFQAWMTIKEHAAKERKRLSQELSGRIALFTEAMQVGHQTPSDQVLKLSVVEARWQDLEDAREGRKQVMAALKEQIKGVEQKIKDQIAEAKSGQLNLFTPAADDSQPAAE